MGTISRQLLLERGSFKIIRQADKTTPLQMEQDRSSPESGAAPSTFHTEDEYEQLKRFQIELEFVQCLANPWYLHHIAQQQHFNQDTFVRYLDYLQYFRKPEYAKYIIYPHCLHFLTLLQHKSFRDHLAKQDTATFVHERQYYHWQYLRNQDKVVRMEIMPDGSLQEIKNEDMSAAHITTGASRVPLLISNTTTTAPGAVMIGAPNGSMAPQL
ncbi:hypothetical protein BGZ65_001292 [Modicella reniformis]|uniref:Mediator of RNA polymerase II transcription subunit 31 n=1 Tax=Modicella reniformis TaxID=1440133 RepID=A0A9P6J2H8_9FUNG|nr:hypothetical protein BGZ65_001292 [Modicella reniformis]